MIVVAGSHRSGTSLWMQILHAAGLPVLGDRFPGKFSALTDINPEGFWETRLRMGVNFTSNPDPETGIYLSPEATRGHALKIFAPGLVRTDVAFLDRVLVTVRPWREHSLSMARLFEVEDAALSRGDSETLEQRQAARRERPVAAEWWFQLHAVIRDLSVRRYPHHIVTHSRLMRAPEREIRAALSWIGQGDPGPTLEVVRPELYTARSPEVPAPEGIDEEMVAVFDAVYAALDEERLLDPALIRRMNEVQRRLRERWPRAR